ncbi:diguanylate cyclase [Pseudomonas capeferrum]|uniref:sensor domain-containing diguanylate cyclase n=1 Tax=Pseudomonas capeferrum TaxID=1495066 RepID=UPI0015E33A69|nr:diguanylate cyclase [Pseudomonas capeferrum]MBA1200783.1 diguanylate cyclase [Pseudomonas capeferrum]
MTFQFSVEKVIQIARWRMVIVVRRCSRPGKRSGDPIQRFLFTTLVTSVESVAIVANRFPDERAAMQIAPSPLNEAARLCFLESLNILDTPAEESFDRITRLAGALLDVPMALVSLVDMNRQWFKSRQGIDVRETTRDVAFCAHALHVEELLVIPDARLDPRFEDNPLVVGEPFVRFYAGVPLRFAGELTVGTLCVLDTRPRQVSDADLANLRDLARIVEREMLHRSLAIDVGAIQQAEQSALVSSDTRFRMVFNNSPTAKAITGLDGRILQANRELCQLLGQAPESLVLLHLADLIDPRDQQDLELFWGRLIAGALDSHVAEVRFSSDAGDTVWVELSMSVLRGEGGEPEQMVVFARDIGERKRRQLQLQRYQATLEQQVAQRTDELERSQETLQAIADNLPVLIAHIDTDLRYRFNNAVYQQIFGLAPARLKGRKVKDVLPEYVYQQLLPCFTKALAGERVEADNMRYSPNDSRIWHATYVPDIRNGKVEGFFVMSLDVTDRKQREKTLLDQATLDSLTGLPNRSALHKELDYVVQHRIPFALYFIDLDGFKQVNDKYGHETGDLLLQAAAERMLTIMRADDTVARLGGDEFVVIAQPVSSQAAIRDIARKLCDTLSAPFDLEEVRVSIGASIGIHVNHSGLAPLTADEVLVRADKAMYEAKRQGRNGYCVAAD